MARRTPPGRPAGLAAAACLAACLAAWTAGPRAAAGEWCLAPAGGQEIQEVDCRAPMADPRCQPACRVPPCEGYPFTVRPAARFTWRAAPPARSYRLTVCNRLSGARRVRELGPADYFQKPDGTCIAIAELAAFLPDMAAPGRGTVPPPVAAELGLDGPGPRMPLVGPYEWTLEALRPGGFELLERETFAYLHNSNPFGTAAIEFRWATGSGSEDCGAIQDPVDFWIHLPIEYPADHPHRSAYEWGYVLIQATSELLGPGPELGEDYGLERLGLPDGPEAANLRLWLRGRDPGPDSRLAYHLVFTLEDPWSEVGWQPESEFDLAGTRMPGGPDLWPLELVEAGYLGSGPQTVPLEEILASYVWCEPYPACVACPWQFHGTWIGTCAKGPEGAFCQPPPCPPEFDPDDRRTWTGTNALEWFRVHRIADPEVDWSIEDNLRALDRLMSRWPILEEGRMVQGMGLGGAYDHNSLLRLFDPAAGLDVLDHWRFTDSPPMAFFTGGLGCSNASTHLGLAMARLANFPARAVCMAHYHNDLELWLPFGPPAGPRYRLGEGRWIRFLGEDIAAAKTRLDPPDSAGGDLASSSLTGIFKTTAYITWDAEDSIPFNWYRGGTEPDFVPCRGRLIDRQWPTVSGGLALPDETVRLLAVVPGRVDLAAGEGFAALRRPDGSPELGRWLLARHLIPLGFERHGYLRRSGGELLFEVLDAGLAPVLVQVIRPGETATIEEPGRLHLAFRTVAADPYMLLEIEEFAPVWQAPATPTPIPTPSPPPTSTPAPPCAELQVELAMPAHFFAPGDPCRLSVQACNPGLPIAGAPLFVVLAAAGQYWFAPSWISWPVGVDYYRCDPLAAGVTEIEVIPPFAWPDGTGAASGLAFLAAITDPEMSRLACPIVIWDFAYGEP